MLKGSAFPCSISKNELCGHFSPYKTESEGKEAEYNILVDGDCIKIDLGVHFDGFVALVAHTIFV